MRTPTRTPVLATLLLALAATGAGAAHAGTVDVSYVEPDRFSDAGRGVDAERVRDALTQVLQALGMAWLPAGQSLHVEVTDIDLAGELRPMYGTMHEVRVLRGRADWPRIELRYTLSRGDQRLDSGTATVSDMAYLAHGDRLAGGPLPYEARMLTQWFRTRFAAPAATQSPAR